MELHPEDEAEGPPAHPPGEKAGGLEVSQARSWLRPGEADHAPMHPCTVHLGEQVVKIQGHKVGGPHPRTKVFPGREAGLCCRMRLCWGAPWGEGSLSWPGAWTTGAVPGATMLILKGVIEGDPTKLRMQPGGRDSVVQPGAGRACASPLGCVQPASWGTGFRGEEVC